MFLEASILVALMSAMRLVISLAGGVTQTFNLLIDCGIGATRRISCCHLVIMTNIITDLERTPETVAATTNVRTISIGLDSQKME